MNCELPIQYLAIHFAIHFAIQYPATWSNSILLDSSTIVVEINLDLIQYSAIHNPIVVDINLDLVELLVVELLVVELLAVS